MREGNNQSNNGDQHLAMKPDAVNARSLSRSGDSEGQRIEPGRQHQTTVPAINSKEKQNLRAKHQAIHGAHVMESRRIPSPGHKGRNSHTEEDEEGTGNKK